MRIETDYSYFFLSLSRYKRYRSRVDRPQTDDRLIHLIQEMDYVRVNTIEHMGIYGRSFNIEGRRN